VPDLGPGAADDDDVEKDRCTSDHQKLDKSAIGKSWRFPDRHADVRLRRADNDA
jgi:hypothetical protein